jgi:hypothetical protein
LRLEKNQVFDNPSHENAVGGSYQGPSFSRAVRRFLERGL